ncbi:hypothetical protein ACN47E_000539 [Coniothyrium glycines]
MITSSTARAPSHLRIACHSRLQRLCLRHLVTMAPAPKRSRALLLLPPLPFPISYPRVKAAYAPSLLTVLKELAKSPRPSEGQALLQIALAVDDLSAAQLHPRSRVYAHVHQLVAHLYKLVCITASKQAIDTEGPEGIDARVTLVSHSKDPDSVGRVSSHESSSDDARHGPVVSVRTLARSSRIWDTVYSVSSGAGLSFLNAFLLHCEITPHYIQIQGGIEHVAEDAGPLTMSTESSKQDRNHLSVAVGGTFDHLHIGHKLLLTMFTFVLADVAEPRVLTVGITGDALLVNKKYAEQLESWKRRQEATHEFLSSLVWFGAEDDARIRVQEFHEPGPNGHAVHVEYPTGLTVRYVEIWDPFGPTITDKEITALVLSLETRGGGEAVNKKRNEQGWDPLEVFEVAVLDASEEGNVDETFQSKLSSTEIRKKRSERLEARFRA